MTLIPDDMCGIAIPKSRTTSPVELRLPPWISGVLLLLLASFVLLLLLAVSLQGETEGANSWRFFLVS